MYSVKKIKGLLLAGMIGFAGVLAGCGGGGAGGTTTGGTGGGTTTTATPSLTVTLEDALGNSLSTLSSSASGVLTATIRDKDGANVSGALVTFVTDSTYGSFNPASGTTLSNAGIASMLISAGASSGAGTVTVTAVWKENGADVSVSNSINYMVSAAGPTSLTVGTPLLGTNPLSAYGTTSVSVTITGASSPLSVNFTSPCAASGKAVLTPSVTTIGGVAIASYRDNGCGNVDTISASVTTGNSATNTLTVTPPSAGSVQFVSASPEVISLRGTGSATLPEASTVRFKILDTAGNPISRSVNFSLSTTLGGIAFSNGLSTASATSDASNGEVQVVVNGGTLPTPLRVNANIASTTIQTQSNQLTVTTGLPSQANTSLSATTLNIDGWRFDGTTTALTIRLADSLSNPVPDGTAINFISEGARVDGSCVTTNSACSVTFTSQALRPTNGRVTVLAYAVGVESFTDLNSNGTVDGSGEMIDSNGNSTDIGEAFVDYNEDQTKNATEPYLDFDGDGSFRVGGDGEYNGVLCTSGASICSTNRTLHVNQGIVIVLSDSQPIAPGANGIFSVASPIDLGGCGVAGVNAGRLTPFSLVLRDLNANPLPAGTKITVSTTNGTVEAGSTAVVPNTNKSFLTFSADPAFNFPIILKNDASPADATCTDTTPNGTLKVTITPPIGPAAEYVIGVSN